MTLCLGSYNICATFFCDPKDDKDTKKNMPHTWSNRRKYFRKTFDLVNCDVMALQELSPEQTLDFFEMFPNHKFFFFVQAQTDDVKAGEIYTNADEIKTNLLGKFIGTPLIGIMYKPNVVVPKKSGIFWYNPNPFEKPTATDRTVTDKGFGNVNTPRGPGYVEFTHVASGKDFYFFTNHAPLSGGSNTRMKCFELENQVIKKMVDSKPFFSIGDRNLLPDAGHDESYKALVPTGTYDWLNKKNHCGAFTTWLSFQYEPLEYHNQMQKDGSFKETWRYVIGTSSLRSVWSAHYHCIIRGDDVQLLGELTEKDNLTRNFLSDHSMVVAKFNL